jgi:hypothetical protein
VPIGANALEEWGAGVRLAFSKKPSAALKKAFFED